MTAGRTSANQARFQLAFQGGGAKLVPLIVAMEVAQHFERQGQLKITRLAGTSAGAILVALAGCGQDMAELRQELKGGEGKRLFSPFIPPRFCLLRWLWMVKGVIRLFVFHLPIISSKPFEAWLGKRLGAIRFSDLSPEVKIVSAELDASSKKLYSESDSVVTALLDSSGLPFVLRMWNLSGSSFVDGGLCENLPVGELNQQAHRRGRVLAISFKPERPEPPRGFAKFSTALLTTAINNSIERAKRDAGPQNVLELPVSFTDKGRVRELKTFDFEFALRFLDEKSPEYQAVAKATETFLSEACQRFLKEDDLDRNAAPGDFWTDPNAWLGKTLERVGTLYDMQHRSECFTYHHVTWEITAAIWQDVNQTCRNKMRLVFSPADRPIYCSTAMLSATSEDGLASTEVETRLTGGDRIPTHLVPMRDPKKPSRRSVMICYIPPLQPGTGPYEETCIDQIRIKPEDMGDIVWCPDRALGVIEKVEFVLYVPDSKPGIHLVPRKQGPGREMTNQELSRFSADGYYPVGFVAENVQVPPGGDIAADIVSRFI
jgi:predicted acylesterase/phospholipase RssA